MHFKVIFDLDGSGVGYDPAEPIHLDALIAWALAPVHTQSQAELTRDDVPLRVPLPLLCTEIKGHLIWNASALFPEGPQGEDLQFWRKRFRQGRADLSDGTPVLDNSTYRDWNSPMPLQLYTRMAAYASGNRKEVKRLLKQLRYLGKKRAHGHGRILRIEYEETPENWSLIKDGRAMRWLPDDQGTRFVRPLPPYWNRHGRTKCCEVGAPLPLSAFSGQPISI